MSKKRIFVSFLLLAVLLTGCLGKGGPGAPTGNLKGHILDAASGELIMEDVSLVLNGKSLTVNNGKYSFGNIATGPQTLRVSAPGYEAVSLIVEIAQGKTESKDIRLKKDRGDVESLIQNLKDAGLAFTGIWESKLQEHLENELVPFIEEASSVLGTFEPGYDFEEDIEFDEATNTLTVTQVWGSGEKAVFEFSGIPEILGGIMPAATETILAASFTMYDRKGKIAHGELIISADLKRDILEEWLQWADFLQGDPPQELFFKTAEAAVDIWFKTAGGDKMEIQGRVDLALDKNSFELTGSVKTPVVEFEGNMALDLKDNNINVYNGVLPVYPSSAELSGLIELPGTARWEGDLALALVPNAVVDSFETILLPKTARFTGSYRELPSGLISAGEFNFNWRNAASYRKPQDLRLTASFQGSVQELGEMPLDLFVDTEIRGLEGRGKVEYRFGGKTLQGGVDVAVTLDSYGMDTVSISLDLKDHFGNQVSADLQTDNWNLEKENKLVSIKDATGREEAAIWLKPDGLLYIKYADGRVEDFI